jgi:hypothetical protein
MSEDQEPYKVSGPRLELKETLRLADQLLDDPGADPDDDLRTLSRQLLRRHADAERYNKALQEIRRIAPLGVDTYRECYRRIQNIVEAAFGGISVELPIPSEVLLCACCNLEPAVAVVSVPGVPFSAAYGRICLEAHVHPWGILVINSGCGGWQHAAGWWKELCRRTYEWWGKTEQEFLAEVAGVEKEMEKYLEEVKVLSEFIKLKDFAP